MRKTFSAVLSAVAAWLLLLSMLLLGVFICTTSRAFYRYEYQKYGQAQTIGITDEGLMRITNALLDYLWGSRDTLDMQAEIGGELREVFTQREKDHMVDVRALVMLARTVMVASLVAGILLWVVGYRMGRRVKGGARASGIGYLAGAGALLLAVGIVTLLALQDFTAVFIRFHEIFFTNDLWILDADDMLIQMVPEPFFADCAALIAGVFGVGTLATAALAIVMTVRDGLSRKAPQSEDEERWKLTAVSGQQGEGEYYKINPSHQEEARPDAEEIFARMGLDDAADGEEEETLPVERLVHPQQEPATVMPSQHPATPPRSVAALADLSEEFPAQLDHQDLSVRFEMKLDLKVSRNEEGQLILSMDPNRKPHISLASQPGQLAFRVDEETVLPTEEDDKEELDSTAQALPRAERIVEPAPTPEELLRQMDELMKGFPHDVKEDDNR